MVAAGMKPVPVNLDSQPPGPRPRILSTILPASLPSGTEPRARTRPRPPSCPLRAAFGALCRTAPPVSPPPLVVASGAFLAPKLKKPPRHRRGGFSQATGRSRLRQATFGSSSWTRANDPPVNGSVGVFLRRTASSAVDAQALTPQRATQVAAALRRGA